MGKGGGGSIPPNRYEIAQGELSRELFQTTDPLRQRLLATYAQPNQVPAAYNPALDLMRSGYGANRTALASNIASLGGPEEAQKYLQSAGQRGMEKSETKNRSMLQQDILDALSKSAYTTAWRAPGQAMEGFGKLASAASARDMAESAAEAQQQAAQMQTAGQLTAAAIIAYALLA